MIEDLLKAAILGTVQGLTEFLPVSSTGHLILLQDLLKVDEDRYGLAFDAAIHLGTLAALLVYFGRRWLDLARSGLRALRDRSSIDGEGRLAWLIVLGTVPAAVLGLAFGGFIEDELRSPVLVAVMLIAFSVVFVAAERFGRRRRELYDLRWRDALFVGLAQALALVPGVSRSGATISAGLFRDVERPDAATFGFLLSAPVIAGAGGLALARSLVDVAQGELGGEEIAFFITGMVFAAIVGYAAIAFLLRFLVTNTLVPFVYYRVGLAVVVLGAVAAGAL